MLSIGSVIGAWTLISVDHIKHKQKYWLAKCECGTLKPVSTSSLSSGGSKSCGCKRVQNFIASQKVVRNTNRKGKPLTLPTIKHDRELHLYTTRFKNSIRDRKGFAGSTLSFDDWKTMVTMPCAYCGTVGSNTQRDFSSGNKLVSTTEIRINGIDRIDPTLPYTIENSVSCCKKCNRMKGSMTSDEFITHIKRVLNYVS